MTGFPPRQVPGYLVEGVPDHAHPFATSKETGVLFKAIRGFKKATKVKGLRSTKSKRKSLPKGHGKNIIRSSTIVTHKRPLF
jgi:hypothetical protein